ncbi:YutD family protein [Fundicoccus sp. Sow4_F4]|uniref:YutD family protein n=1 Tax=Fundicoccus sp. Sow4_F4 TaxID=3438783 RepID=UPI003F8F9BD6
MSKQIENSMSGQLEAILTDIANETTEITKDIHQIDDDHIQIKNQSYQIVTNYREGFKIDAFEQRYQDFFDKFDFIVGDWGYEQLRLRGFYQVNQRKVPRDQTINFLDDYLKEYCNFGCQYFVIAKDSALEKYQQYVSRTKTNTVPLADVASSNEPIVATKAPSFNQKNRRRKRQQRGRNASMPQTTEIKEEFQIRNQVNQSARKALPTKVGNNVIKATEAKPTTEKTKQTKGQSQTVNKKAFVIKKKANPKVEN